MHKKGKLINLAGAFGGSKIDFVKPINYIIYKYFKFLSFSFILLHEIGHIEMGHLTYAEERMGIRKLYSNGLSATKDEVYQAFEMSTDVQSSVLIFYLTRMVTLDDRLRKIIGNDFEVNLPDGIAVFLSSLMNVYIPLIVPYYLLSIYPVVSEEVSHPPAILRSFFCRNGLYLDKGFRDMIHENEFKAMVASWDWYENQLLSSDYCGEKELVNTNQWKDRKDKFGFYMELLINLKMPLGFTYYKTESKNG